MTDGEGWFARAVACKFVLNEPARRRLVPRLHKKKETYRHVAMHSLAHTSTYYVVVIFRLLRSTSRSLPFINRFTSNVRHHKPFLFIFATYPVVLLLALHVLKIATNQIVAQS